MKKVLTIITIISILLSIFVGCSNNNSSSSSTKQTTKEGLQAANDEYELSEEKITDKDGKAVTDKNGKAVTTQVNIKYTTDKNGNQIAIKVDKNGDPIKDKKGNNVTVKITTKKSENKTTNKTTTAPTQKSEETTNENITTLPVEKDKVPNTTATGKTVTFSAYDQQIIKEMLEVPYLYESSYENSQGVPISIATHAALWMYNNEKESNSMNPDKGTIILQLFKFFGQTVVNFKDKCNSANNENITYDSKSEIFKIKSFEKSTHTISIKKIEYLGNNNYYKVTASVSGTKATSVVAIIQKNQLDTKLGFSIKALKWS